MAISMKWDDAEESIVIIEVTGGFSWDEVLEANKQAVDMVGSKAYRCDVIYNLLNGKANSYGSALQNGRNIIKAFPENMGILVLATQSLGRILLNPLKRLDPTIAPKAHVASRVDLARKMIQDSRAAK